jgi:dihydroorotate dehydrogenase electron transfer subunit
MISQEKSRVLFCEQKAADTFLLRVYAPILSASAKPGQIVFIRTGTNYLPLLRRPFAVFDVFEKQQTMDVLFDVVGKGTLLLSRSKENDILDILGPSGNGFPLFDSSDETIIALAGGCGIGPIHFACRYFAQRKKKVHLFYGTQTLQKTAMQSFPNLENAIIASDDGSFGEKGFITEVLEKRISTFPKSSVLIACGPVPMLKAALKIAEKAGWECYVSLERHMACGVGACNGCVVSTVSRSGKIRQKRVCKDGPVFLAKEILWT